MTPGRGRRTRRSNASTIGFSVSATNSAIAARRSTSRVRQTRYRATAQAATMATSRTTPLREGAARRTVGPGSGIAATVRRAGRWARPIGRRRHKRRAQDDRTWERRADCGSTTRRRGPCATRRETPGLWPRHTPRLATREQRTHARPMEENIIVATFSEDSRTYEALARLKELAAEGQIDLHDGAVVERAQDGTLGLRDEAGNEDDGVATLTGGTIGLLIGI